MDFKIGEFIRGGPYKGISRVTEVFNSCIEREDGHRIWSTHFKNIKRDSKLTNLIEKGDIIFWKLPNSEHYKISEVKFFRDRNNQRFLGAEGWSFNQILVLKIITKEELETVGYGIL